MIKNVKSNAATPAALNGDYVSPSAKVVLFQSEGVLCSSVEGLSHEEFSEGGYYEL